MFGQEKNLWWLWALKFVSSFFCFVTFLMSSPIYFTSFALCAPISHPKNTPIQHFSLRCDDFNLTALTQDLKLITFFLCALCRLRSQIVRRKKEKLISLLLSCERTGHLALTVQNTWEKSPQFFSNKKKLTHSPIYVIETMWLQEADCNYEKTEEKGI